MLAYYLVSHEAEPENTFFDVDLAAGRNAMVPGSQFFTIDVKRVYSPDDEIIYFMNGRPFYLNDLIPVLKEVSRLSPGMTAVINFAPNAKYKKLVSLIDACTYSGINKVSLVCEKTQVAEKN
jgi:biopolymer transport protein ExbD